MIEDAHPGGLFRLTPIGMAVSAPSAQAAAHDASPAASGAESKAGPGSASNAEHVKSILEDNNCLVCHRIGHEGGDIGPSLNGVGTRRTADQIRAAIVSPPPTTSAGAKDPMPSYEKKITRNDLNSLVEYLRTLPAASR